MRIFFANKNFSIDLYREKKILKIREFREFLKKKILLLFSRTYVYKIKTYFMVGPKYSY